MCHIRSGCDSLSPDGIASLATLSHLRYLDLGGSLHMVLTVLYMALTVLYMALTVLYMP